MNKHSSVITMMQGPTNIKFFIMHEDGCQSCLNLTISKV